MHTDELNTEDEHTDILRFGIRPRARWVARALIWSYGAVYVTVDVGLIFSPRIAPVVRIACLVVWSLVMGVLLVWADRRMLRATVLAGPTGLHIFNGIRTHVVPWNEVEGFVPSSKPFLMAVKRTHGRPITMTGLTPETFGNREPQRQDMEKLEAYWRQVRVS